MMHLEISVRICSLQNYLVPTQNTLQTKMYPEKFNTNLIKNTTFTRICYRHAHNFYTYTFLFYTLYLYTYVYVYGNIK